MIPTATCGHSDHRMAWSTRTSKEIAMDEKPPEDADKLAVNLAHLLPGCQIRQLVHAIADPQEIRRLDLADEDARVGRLQRLLFAKRELLDQLFAWPQTRVAYFDVAVRRQAGQANQVAG